MVTGLEDGAFNVSRLNATEDEALRVPSGSTSQEAAKDPAYEIGIAAHPRPSRRIYRELTCLRHPQPQQRQAHTTTGVERGSDSMHLALHPRSKILFPDDTRSIRHPSIVQLPASRYPPPFTHSARGNPPSSYPGIPSRLSLIAERLAAAHGQCLSIAYCGLSHGLCRSSPAPQSCRRLVASLLERICRHAGYQD